MGNTQRKEEYGRDFQGGRREVRMNPAGGSRRGTQRERTVQRPPSRRVPGNVRPKAGTSMEGRYRDGGMPRRVPQERRETERPLPVREERRKRKSSHSRGRKRRQKKRSFFKRSVRLLVTLAGSLLLLSLVIRVMEEPPWHFGKLPEEKPAAMEPASSVSQEPAASLLPEVEKGLKELALEDSRVNDILENYGKYPEKLLETLVKNPETLDFVLDYPEKKDTKPADSIGDVKKGTIPHLLQWDERWGYGEYGGSLLACTGCGPTCLSMVIAGLTGDNTITPYVVARYAQENGYYETGAGTKWSLMSEGAAKYKIQGREISPDETAVAAELDAGHPIICSMGPGDFTTAGHFIVLTGRKDGKIQVNDPNSRIRSEKLWDYADLKWQIRNLWAFE